MNIIDKYILKNLITTLVFALIALCVIFLIVNLLENLDKFLDKDISYKVIIFYYFHYFPEILKILTPVALLIATLFTIGKLSTQNEITSMKTGGMSLYRIMIPMVIFSIILSFGQLYFNGWVVPKSLEKKFQIEEEYLHKRISSGPIYDLYFRDDPSTNVVMQFYDSKRKTGNKITIEKFTLSNNPKMLERIEARKIEWDSVSNKWILISGIRRILKEKLELYNFDSMQVDLHISHSKISQLKRSPDEMNFTELKDYIGLMERGGKDIRKELIEYYGNYAFPFSNFIVILFAIPFASVRRKGGLAIQIGAALTISFLYLVFSKISQTMGFAADINPILAGWFANIIFFALGAFLILRTKT